MGIPYRLASFDVGGGGKETKALYFSGLEGLGPSDDAMCTGFQRLSWKISNIGCLVGASSQENRVHGWW